VPELFETFDDADQPAGLVPRTVVHELGLWHRTSNVFLFRTDGQLIVQCRQKSKDVWPGAWDLSVAEHLKPGEDYLACAIRGLLEELGIEYVDLEPIGGVIRSRLEVAELGIKDYELQRCYKGVSDAALLPNPDEVAEIKLFTLAELEIAMDEAPTDFTPWFRDRAQDVHLFG
jgi:isopentenyl-diphosphate delta-isomerase